MRRFVIFSLFTVAAFGAAATAAAHCQIPCGIYDDELRVQLIEEHITTVEKSMKQVVELGGQDSPDLHQLVRWIDNKEHHAQEIQDIVAAYFMTQRIEVPANREGDAWRDYQTKLSLLHQIQVAAMKAKQTTDLKWIEELRSLVKAFRTAYFGEQGGHTH
jgi:nickel superoxide dismutase